jgi:hypothetical protein
MMCNWMLYWKPLARIDFVKFILKIALEQKVIQPTKEDNFINLEDINYRVLFAMGGIFK